MSDFLYSDEFPDSTDTRFNPDTDGFVDCAYESAVDLKLAKNDLTKYDTLRKYLQAHLHHLLNVSPEIITMEHLDKVFDQNIFNMSNYMTPEQKTSSIEIANMLLGSLTQDWLDLPIKQGFPYSQSNCTGIRFVFMPRTSQNHVFYDLIQNAQML